MAGYWRQVWGAVTGAGRRQEGLLSGDSGTAEKPPVPVNYDTALQVSAVWACTRIISEAISGMPLRAYRRLPDGSRQEVFNHELVRLFNRSPNRWQTRQELMETSTMSLSMLGNSYNLLQRNASGQIIGIVPLMTKQMEVRLLGDGSRVYTYTNGNDVRVYSQKSIWHCMLMPSNGVIGLSPLSYASRTIGVAQSGENRVSNLARNGFKPTGVLMIDKLLTPEQREQIRTEFSNLQTSSGDPLRVLEAGMEYQQISMSPKDVQLLETRRFSIEDIARFWGVPSVLINDTQSSTTWGSGIQQIVEGFYKFGLRPYLERYESSIEKWLLPESDRGNIEVEFDFKSLLRADEKTRIENLRNAIGGPFMTTNEGRMMEGLGPVDGGDEIYKQQQDIPLSIAQEGQQDVSEV